MKSYEHRRGIKEADNNQIDPDQTDATEHVTKFINAGQLDEDKPGDNRTHRSSSSDTNSVSSSDAEQKE